MPLHLMIDDVAVSVADAANAPDACERVVAAVARHSDAMVAAFLQVRDHLRSVAATGSWQMVSSVPLDRGVIGRVHTSGQPVVLTDIATDPDYVELNTRVTREVCVPIRCPLGRPQGVLNLEWAHPEPTATWSAAQWLAAATTVAELLGERIAALGGAPAESRGEQLLRHALAFTAARDDAELLDRSLQAARDVTGLSTPVLLMSSRHGARAHIEAGRPSEIATHLAETEPAALGRLVDRVRQYGASHTLGQPASSDLDGYEPVVRAGAKTMIAVPVGPPNDGADRHRTATGVLLVLDDQPCRPDAETVNLTELLAAQAWTCLDRLHTLRILHQRASSDPLTGLRHHGPFEERLATDTSDGTALLAIDVDGFKSVNDTYGHQAGDRALVELVHALTAALRDADELYRIGGDEFAAVVRVQHVDEALGIAERLVNAARQTGYTISVGVAVRSAAEPGENTLRRADAALYLAKRSGRDGVRLADTRPDPVPAQATGPDPAAARSHTGQPSTGQVGGQ